jgi:hypothetical protein
MIVVADKDVLFAADISEEATEQNKELVFVCTPKELKEAAAKKPEIIFANVDLLDFKSAELVRKKGAKLVAYYGKGKKPAKSLEKLCDALITREEFEKKLPTLLKQI